MAASLTGYLMAAQENPAELYKVGLGSVRFLMSVGDLVIGWLLAKQAAVAIEALDNGAGDADRAFYEGKIGVASFFAKNFLPLLTSTRQVVETPRQRRDGTGRSGVLSLLPLRNQNAPGLFPGGRLRPAVGRRGFQMIGAGSGGHLGASHWSRASGFQPSCRLFGLVTPEPVVRSIVRL